MDTFVVDGPTRLEGSVRLHGAKNAVLPVMAASLLTRGESIIENVPHLRDVPTMMRLLDILGARTPLEDGVPSSDTAGPGGADAPRTSLTAGRHSAGAT